MNQNKNKIIDTINIFNEIYNQDLIKNPKVKNWSSYLEPISLNLYQKSYEDFQKMFSLDYVTTPGSLEAYYNFFKNLSKNCETLTSLEVADEIYLCVSKVLDEFEIFLKDYTVSKSKQNDSSIDYYWYNIYPIV